jgi:hypothetical protein
MNARMAFLRYFDTQRNMNTLASWRCQATAATVRETVEQESYWEFLTELVRSEAMRAMTVV